MDEKEVEHKLHDLRKLFSISLRGYWHGPCHPLWQRNYLFVYYKEQILAKQHFVGGDCHVGFGHCAPCRFSIGTAEWLS